MNELALTARSPAAAAAPRRGRRPGIEVYERRRPFGGALAVAGPSDRKPVVSGPPSEVYSHVAPVQAREASAGLDAAFG
jgi:hypothetical protein